MTQKKIAIIGAGLSGSYLASTLSKAGCDVAVFEKSRGSGGRMSSSRLGDGAADLGCPYFEPLSPAFTHWLEQQPNTERWEARLTHHVEGIGEVFNPWVANPRMSALTRHLLADAHLNTQVRISSVWPDKEGVLLRDEEGHSIDHFDAVIITAPTPQAANLLEAIPRFEHKAEELMPNPRFVALLGLSKPVDTNAQVLLNSDNGACLRRAILDSAKPGHQSGGFSQIWQLETHEDWAKEHVDVPTDQIANRMIESFEQWLGQSIEVAHFRCHRWLYATHPSVNPTPYLWSETDGIGVVGDWLTCEETPKETTAAERAWLSAHALASHLISQWK